MEQNEYNQQLIKYLNTQVEEFHTKISGTEDNQLLKQKINEHVIDLLKEHDPNLLLMCIHNATFMTIFTQCFVEYIIESPDALYLPSVYKFSMREFFSRYIYSYLPRNPEDYNV